MSQKSEQSYAERTGFVPIEISKEVYDKIQQYRKSQGCTLRAATAVVFEVFEAASPQTKERARRRAFQQA